MARFPSWLEETQTARTHALYSLALTALVLSGSASMADEVWLSDGSRLVDVVQRMIEGKLTLTTRHAGTLEIDAQAVTSMSTDDAVDVSLPSGDRLVGPIASPPACDVVLSDPPRGATPTCIRHPNKSQAPRRAGCACYLLLWADYFGQKRQTRQSLSGGARHGQRALALVVPHIGV